MAIYLSPDVVKIAEANENLRDAMHCASLQLTAELLQKYGHKISNDAPDVVEKDTFPTKVEPFVLPPALEAKRVQLNKMETSFETDVAYRTPENYDTYKKLYEEFEKLAVPLYEARIAELKRKYTEAQNERSIKLKYVNSEAMNNDEFRAEIDKITSKLSKIKKDCKTQRDKLTVELREISAGPALGHCTIENKSPEVLAVEKELQLEMVDYKNRSYIVSTINNKFASMLSRFKNIVTYVVYTKGKNLYFNYLDKKTGDNITYKYYLTDSGDEIKKIKKKNNEDWDDSPAVSTRWKLPHPPANKDIKMKR